MEYNLTVVLPNSPQNGKTPPLTEKFLRPAAALFHFFL
jgi:hypothetical protein